MKSPPSQNGTTGLTLRTKMLFLSIAAFSGILIVAVVCLVLLNQSRIGGSSYETIKKDKDALESIALLKSGIYQIHSELQNFVQEKDNTATKKIQDSILNLVNDIELNFGIVLESVESPQKKEAINKAEIIWLEYRKTLLDDVLPAANKGDIQRASSLMTGLQSQRFSLFSSSVAQMVDIIRKDVRITEEQVASSIKIKMAIAGFIVLVTIAVIAGFSYIITISITRPLRACVKFAQEVADGKLDARLDVTCGGETAVLAAAMNTMAENLHSMVSRVSTATDVFKTIDSSMGKAARKVVNSAQLQETAVKETSQAVVLINTSVTDVSEGINQLAVSATETAASTLEMAASIEEVAISADKLGDSVDDVRSSIIEMAAAIKEISSSIVSLLGASSTTSSSIVMMDATIKQVEKNAMDTSAITEGVKNDAEVGKNAVEEAIKGMQAIRTSSEITAEVIENLSLRANDIGTILSVIDEVADQTNLLALNAAIIAAQAGEHGRGFAVLADEIRELAERTSSSTREIAAVIKGVQEETRRAVQAINKARESITEGEKLSQHSGTALAKIVGGIQRASIQVREIAHTTVEQARGSQRIKEAMESVEEMVGQIANSASEHSRGTDLVANAIERMKDLTSHVRISTREQSQTANLIAEATENVTAMIEQIRGASNSQTENSARISGAVDRIQASTSTNSEAAVVMQDSVTALSRQIDLLEKEMSGFRI